ncbi:unnamed protein product, partial [marine sediment metagenome]
KDDDVKKLWFRQKINLHVKVLFTIYKGSPS